MLPLLCIELWLNLSYFYYTDCLHKSIHYLLRGKAYTFKPWLNSLLYCLSKM